MSNLTYLNDASVLHNLKQRYYAKLIYVRLFARNREMLAPSFLPVWGWGGLCLALSGLELSLFCLRAATTFVFVAQNAKTRPATFCRILRFYTPLRHLRLMARQDARILCRNVVVKQDDMLRRLLFSRSRPDENFSIQCFHHQRMHDFFIYFFSFLVRGWRRQSTVTCCDVSWFFIFLLFRFLYFVFTSV